MQFDVGYVKDPCFVARVLNHVNVNTDQTRENQTRYCSIAVVTFMSHDLGNHVLCRVCHLVNRIVVFLESRVFSSLSKLLQLHKYINVVAEHFSDH